MRKAIVTTLSASALLLSAAHAAPKAKAPVGPFKTQVMCNVTVKDANGKVIGQRTYTDNAVSPVLQRARGDKKWSDDGIIDTIAPLE